jgi:hypothetical protein
VFIQQIDTSLYAGEEIDGSMSDFIMSAISAMLFDSTAQCTWLLNAVQALMYDTQPRVDYWIRQFLSSNRNRTAANYDQAAEGENLEEGGRTDQRQGKARTRTTNDKEKANQSVDRKSGVATQDQIQEGIHQALQEQQYNNHLRKNTDP